jgi:hypothetical protein
MFEFGQVLTLMIGLVATAYFASNWRRIKAQPLLRALIGPFILLMVAWLAAVVESFFYGARSGLIVYEQESVEMAHASGLGAEIANLLQHVAMTAAAVWLLAVVWRTSQPASGKRP